MWKRNVRADAGGEPLTVEVYFVIEEFEGRCPFGDFGLDTRAMGGEEATAAVQGGVALFGEGGVFADVGDGHACAAEAVNEIEPVEMEMGISTAAAAVAPNAGDEALGFVPADGVDAAAGEGGELADTEDSLGHLGVVVKPIRQARVYSRSRGIFGRRVERERECL